MDSGSIAEFEKSSASATAAAAAAAASLRYSENFNRAEFANEEEMQDVVESFELLHRSIPWLQRAGVSSESHCGQLKILQAAIDYIIDLEEQLAEQLTAGGLCMVELTSLAAAGSPGARRPFADINGDGASSQHDLSQPSVGLFPGTESELSRQC